LNWNGGDAAFLPGTGGFAEVDTGIHAPVVWNASAAATKFSLSVALNGSLGLYLSPFAEETTVHIRSNSPNPNFQGSWLPVERSVTASGFDATWSVSYLGRNYPQSWTAGRAVRQAVEDSRFGVELTEPIDQYRMADRSVKYAGLFVLLTFTCIWLVEVLAGVRVHPIQYLMVGAALCVFYLLELSLSEHIRFSFAYGIACLSIVAMVAAYSYVIFRRVRQSSVVSMGVSLLYVYLFVLLTNEDAALLAGSIGLFVILAVVMFVTRGVDWYAGRRGVAERTG
jgi:inner membrane protein